MTEFAGGFIACLVIVLGVNGFRMIRETLKQERKSHDANADYVTVDGPSGGRRVRAKDWKPVVIVPSRPSGP